MDTNTRWAVMKLNPEIAPNCPRCASSNTKFCYYNNYSLTQPRYFCKGCRRYWTKGGSLRNVPVGGGCRKSRRGRSSRVSTASAETIPSYMSRSSDCSDQLMTQDSNNVSGRDIDMAAVFAKFLDPNSETESKDQETDQSKDDDPFFELTSSLGSISNEDESFLIDGNNSDNTGGLFGQEVMQEFVVAGHETFEVSYDESFGLDDLLSDQVIPCPDTIWPSYTTSLDADAFCQSIVHPSSSPDLESMPFPFLDDYNHMKGSGNGDHNWNLGSCFDVTSYEAFSSP